MTGLSLTALEALLSSVRIDPAVAELAPDYRVMLLAADGLVEPPGEDVGDRLLSNAEAAARELISAGPVEDVEHIAAWREAYRAFGAQPSRTRNSLESLMRRAAGGGLPRVNPLTDVYNAVSVLHQIPIGGEDLSAYVGAPALVRADGSEAFDTLADGEEITETPQAGEVIWRDEAGVTCRRWNWRQGRRTRLGEDTASALFILDALAPMSDSALRAATDDLARHLRAWGTEVRIVGKMLSASSER